MQTWKHERALWFIDWPRVQWGWKAEYKENCHTKNSCPFHHRGLQCKSRKSEIPGVTGKFSLGVQNEVRQRLKEFGREPTGHSKHPLPTTQEMTLHMDITRWSITKSDWLYSLQLKMEKLYSKTSSTAKIRPGTDWMRSRTPYCKVQT